MKKWIMAMPAFLAAGIAATPALTCPICWPLYAGFLSAMGLGFVDYTPYLFPVTVVLLLISLFPLGWKAKSRRGYLPLAGGLLAAILILSGKFYLATAGVSYVGIFLLLLASVWNLWPKNMACPSCQEDNT